MSTLGTDILFFSQRRETNSAFWNSFGVERREREEVLPGPAPLHLGLRHRSKYRVCQKMTQLQLVFVRSSSNIHQIWQFLAHTDSQENKIMWGYLSWVSGFDFVEGRIAVNTELELQFSLWCCNGECELERRPAGDVRNSTWRRKIEVFAVAVKPGWTSTSVRSNEDEWPTGLRPDDDGTRRACDVARTTHVDCWYCSCLTERRRRRRWLAVSSTSTCRHAYS